MSYGLSWTVALLWLTAVAVVGVVGAEGQTANRAAWMANGSFGVMVHYLPEPQGATEAEKTADFNNIVNQFDMDGFIGQFRQTGADWLIITLGQGSGYLNSGNSKIDSILPGHTPQRDLALEVAQRVNALGKRTLLYYPSETQADWAVKQALGYGTAGYEGRYFDFLRQYSIKFGDLCDGWWFDSCQPHTNSYWNTWLSAVRAGNSNAAIAFSVAEFFQDGAVTPLTVREDYLAGEIHLLEDGHIRRDFLPPGGDIYTTADGDLRLRGQDPIYYLPNGPSIDGVQWHGLLPLDLTFNPAIPSEFCQYTDAELISFVNSVKAVGGAITINVPIDIYGHIPADSEAHLVQVGMSLGVPEPSMITLLIIGFIGLLSHFCWKRR